MVDNDDCYLNYFTTKNSTLTIFTNTKSSSLTAVENNDFDEVSELVKVFSILSSEFSLLPGSLIPISFVELS